MTQQSLLHLPPPLAQPLLPLLPPLLPLLLPLLRLVQLRMTAVGTGRTSDFHHTSDPCIMTWKSSQRWTKTPTLAQWRFGWSWPAQTGIYGCTSGKTRSLGSPSWGIAMGKRYNSVNALSIDHRSILWWSSHNSCSPMPMMTNWRTPTFWPCSFLVNSMVLWWGSTGPHTRKMAWPSNVFFIYCVY